MAQVVISNVDENVKQNFEQFCANAGMNTARVFSALVEVAISFNRQGLLLNAAIEPRQQVNAKSQRQGEAMDRLLLALSATDEKLTEGFDNILAQGINLRGVDL